MSAVRDTTWLALSPLDSWFFGDGRPNNLGEDQADLRSLFPPPAQTVVGAIRAAAARSLGWRSGPWPGEITALLGDGLDPGPLRFTGPFLTRDGELVFPAPRHLLGSSGDDGTWQPRDFLAPGEQEVRTDLAEQAIRLPEPLGLASSAERLAEADEIWLTTDGMEQVLAGALPKPEHCVPAEQLFVLEPRVGLERKPETRTALEGALYSPTHVRLRPGVRLVVGVDGLPAEVRLPELLAIGGESRLAMCETIAAPMLPTAGVPEGEASVVVLLTPARLLDETESAWRVPIHGAPAAALLPGAAGEIESLCLMRPLRVGGWDSVGHRPRPLTPLVPAGTVWFLRGTALGGAPPRIGTMTGFGYGHVVGGLSPRAATNTQNPLSP